MDCEKGSFGEFVQASLVGLLDDIVDVNMEFKLRSTVTQDL